MQADDVDLLERCVRIYGKGSKERMIQLENAEVLGTLDTYKQLEPSQPGEPFFKNRLNHPLSDQSVRLIVCKYAKKTGYTTHITPICFDIPSPPYCWKQMWTSATYKSFWVTVPFLQPRFIHS